MATPLLGSSSGSPYQWILRLHDHCRNVAERKYLLPTFYEQFEAGSLFHLLFRATAFTPPFRASIGMLPMPLQRMIERTPVQALPTWFRNRVVVRQTTNLPHTPNAQPTAQNTIDQLEVTLYEYYFLACASFLCQRDVKVESSSSATVSLKAKDPQPVGPPKPDEYNNTFLKMIQNYLDFFMPLRGVHSSSLKLEEKGWNVPAILSHGQTMLETLVELWFGQFSYEAAQPINNTQNPTGFGSPQQLGVGGMPSYIPPDDHALPSRKMILAFQTIVYHMLELSYVESPATPTEVSAVTATRASIMSYQQEKYARHADGPITRLRIDWHLFGVIQHCFTRWASEWATPIGILPVPIMEVNDSRVVQYLESSTRLDDRLSKVLELWLDYLEPWKSIYNEDYNPLIWRWWIVSNLPFFTVLLRDFLRLLAHLDLGREKTAARILHLKSVIKVLALFEGPVMQEIEEIEGLLFRGTGGQSTGIGGGMGGAAATMGAHHTATNGFAGLGQRTETTGQRAETQNQMLQQEVFVVRNSLLQLCGLRPENYIPVFPSSASLLVQSASVKSMPLLASPRSMQQQQAASPYTRHNQTHQNMPQQSYAKLESQGLAEELISMWSVGYSPSEVTGDKESALLKAAVYPPAPKFTGEQPKPLSPSLSQQEEQAGQLIEHRLRMMFGLASASHERREIGSPRNQNVNPRAGPTHPPPPISFQQLQPSYDTSGVDHLPRLTAAGRERVKRGLALCSKDDIPVLGDEEELPVCTYEYATLVRATRWTNQIILNKTGRKVELRFMASQQFLIAVVVLLGIILLLRCVL